MPVVKVQPSRPYRLAFRLTAAAFVVAVAFHAVAITVPAFAAMVYPTGYPLARHVFFILIDASFAGLFLRRPNWLIWPYGLLAAYVIPHTGSYAADMWRQQGRITWISFVKLLGVILGLGLLWADWRARRTPGHH